MIRSSSRPGPRAGSSRCRKPGLGNIARLWIGLLGLAALLTPPGADATPSPAVITRDTLVAANARSFFVLRAIAIHPGSYYQRRERLEFLELSAWDGTVRAACTLRHVSYTDDATTPEPDWTASETLQPPCDIAGRLAAAGAALALPAPAGPTHWPLRLADDAILIRRGADATPDHLLDWAYVDRRARAMSPVASDDTPCPYCTATEGLTPTEACSLAPRVTELPQAPWVFLHLTCWDGSSDLSGASLFIPVSLNTWRGGTSE